MSKQVNHPTVKLSGLVFFLLYSAPMSEHQNFLPQPDQSCCRCVLD